MELTIKIKYEYGAKRYYPVCKNADTFVKLMGKKTFSKDDIDLIKLLGHTFKVEAEVL
jgi:hypothetical protein